MIASGSEPLKRAVWEAFARNKADGMSDTGAYRRASGKKNMSQNSVGRTVGRARTQWPELAARIAYLQSAAASERTFSRAEKREILKAEALKIRRKLDAGIKDGDLKAVKTLGGLFCKLVDIDNAISGDKGQQESDGGVVVNIVNYLGAQKGAGNA
jgi:hypothetical protein